MTTALVLAGHGSHISPNTAGIVWDMVDELRRLNVADEVTAAFWKEFPSFHQVLDTLTSDEIIVVPVFTARGYFTQTVIPAEMGLEGDITIREGRTIHYTATLGEHPDLKNIALRRVIQTMDDYGLDPQQTAVAVIGHGTRRSSESRITTQAQAEVIRESGAVAEVVAVFLDDTPDIPDIYPMTSAPNIIAVPYFLAFGSHTTIDVPQKLGLDSGTTFGQVHGRSVFYTAPVGADSGLIDVVLKLAGLTPRESLSEWDNFPQAGRQYLTNEMIFGELMITPDSVQVVGDEGEKIKIQTPKQLRDIVRDDYRPLPTSRGLPGGWMVEMHVGDELHAVLATVYPGVVADWARGDHLPTQSLQEVAARQTGMLRELASITRDDQEALVNNICGVCVRHATWFDGITGEIPCPEPCNFWMSKAKEIFK